MKRMNSVSTVTLDELYQAKLKLVATESRLEIYNDIMHELDAHNFLNEINEIKYRIGGGKKRRGRFCQGTWVRDRPPPINPTINAATLAFSLLLPMYLS